MSLDGSRDDPTTRPVPQWAQPPGQAPRASTGQSSPTQPSPYPTQPSQSSPYPTQPAGHPTRSAAYPTRPGAFADQPTQAFAAPTQGPVNGTPPSIDSPPSGPRRRRGAGSPAFLVSAAIGVLLVLGAGITVVALTLHGSQLDDAPSGTPSTTGKAAALPAGRTWLSGAWTGGGISVNRIDTFGTWRGQTADVVTTYPAYDTWEQLKGSEWHVSTLDAFKGRISYGLPLLPKNDSGTLADVAAGKHDDVFQAVARILLHHHRPDAFVRIGLEANGTWFPWGADADRADDYKAAWRHVQSVMKTVAPTLVFGFDITCGKALEGGKDRMDSLTRLYPGDDVVDVVGCDHYDSYTVKSRNGGEWERTLRPANAAGLADVADFARAHHKKLAIPEWGLTSTSKDGSGDNPFFIYSMYGFFLQNKDILLYENYFNEAADSLGSAIWDSAANPKAAAEYRKLWGAAPHLTAARG